jgi:hypothetical protein
MAKAKRFLKEAAIVAGLSALTLAVIVALAVAGIVAPVPTAAICGLIWGWMIRDWMGGSDNEEV